MEQQDLCVKITMNEFMVGFPPVSAGANSNDAKLKLLERRLTGEPNTSTYHTNFQQLHLEKVKNTPRNHFCQASCLGQSFRIRSQQVSMYDMFTRRQGNITRRNLGMGCY